MRTPVLFAAAVSLLLATFSARAGQLTVAVMQFSDERNLTVVGQSLNAVDLAAITDSDRTETNEPGLRGGWVIFAQTLNVNPGGRFAGSTRLANQRADVSGSLNGSQLDVRINILEGVKVGLRKHRENTYEASGSVAGGVPQLIGVRQSKGKTQTAIKGRSNIVSVNFTTIIAAKYTP
jgi:hypothetical protein